MTSTQARSAEAAWNTTQPLRLLLIQARSADAAPIARHLADLGYPIEIESAHAVEDVRRAIDAATFDVAVADDVAKVDAATVLDLLRASGRDVPLIIVASEDGEEAAVAMMRRGARDYVVRRDLTRLGPTIEREARDSLARQRQRRSEESLHKETVRRRVLMGASLDGICIINQRHEVVEANERFARMLGYTADEILTLHTWDWEAALSESQIREAFADLTTTAAVFETRHRRKDGSIYDAEVSASGVRVGDEPLVLTVSRDITARKQAERALAESEERFRGIFQSATDGILVSAVADDRVLMANRAMCAMLGYSEDELLRLRLEDVVPERDRAGDAGAPSMTDATGHLAKSVPVRRKDASILLADVSSVFLETGGRRCVLSLFRDMTAYNELEAQMRQAQKFEAIGHLAGGVAHDFNNILGVIQGHCELALAGIADGDPLHADLEQILAGAQRAAAVTRQLLAFSRKQTLRPRVLDLNTTIEGLQSMARRLIGVDIRLVLALSPDLWRVKVDPGQIEQVIVNLVANARDAMPCGGVLRIQTENLTLDVDRARGHTRMARGVYVTFSVADTGVGMSQGILERLFEPFFTTKEKGTGLGLSTAYGIVKQSGGFIWADSRPGKGSTFEVVLPRTEEPLEVPPPALVDVPSRGEGQTILIVEDEAPLRRMVQIALEQLGYRTVVASNGAEALKIVRDGTARADLVLTDVVMPEMGGPALVERLRGIDPTTRAVFMSGYPDAGAAHQDDLPAGAPLIQKPFRIADLAAKVRQVLLDPNQ